MKFTVETGTPATVRTPCLVAGVKQAARIAADAGAKALFDAALRDFQDQPGRTLTVQLPAGGAIERLLVVGGADGELTAASYRKITDAAARALR
ncbi:MAG: M17 family peptidase N-terminal domain-containing protein, partial [Gammaproteobacteria bacterium]